MAVDGRFKTICDQWKQTSGYPVLRKGRLEPAYDESKHGSIILHPTRAPQEELARQMRYTLRTGKPLDPSVIQDSLVTIYRVSPQVRLDRSSRRLTA